MPFNEALKRVWASPPQPKIAKKKAKSKATKENRLLGRFFTVCRVVGLRPIRAPPRIGETLTAPRSEYSRMVTRCFGSIGQHLCAASLKLATPASSRIFFMSCAVSPVALSSVVPNVTAFVIRKLAYIDRFSLGIPLQAILCWQKLQPYLLPCIDETRTTLTYPGRTTLQ